MHIMLAFTRVIRYPFLEQHTTIFFTHLFPYGKNVPQVMLSPNLIRNLNIHMQKRRMKMAFQAHQEDR